MSGTTVDRKEMLRALEAITLAHGTKPQSHEDYVIIYLQYDVLHLCSYGYHHGDCGFVLTARVATGTNNCQHGFRALVALSSLRSVLKKCPSNTIEMSYIHRPGNNAAIRIKYSSGHSENGVELMCRMHLEFPDRPPIADYDALAPMPSSVDMVEFWRQMRCAISHSAVNDPRMFLNGLLMSERGPVAATDGHRLYVQRDNDTGYDNEHIMPRSIAAALCKYFESNTGAGLRFGSLGENRVAMTPDMCLIYQAYLGEYPDWTLVIPDKSRLRVTVAQRLLAAALKSVSALDASCNCVNFTTDGSFFELLTNDRYGEETLISRIPTIASNTKLDTPLRIGINPNFMRDTLMQNSKSDGVIHIYFCDELSPVVIRPPYNDNELSVIMPVRIR